MTNMASKYDINIKYKQIGFLGLRSLRGPTLEEKDHVVTNVIKLG